ncbi:MAG: hypothetical protein VKK03_01555 [Synechococcus sp.]|nr:hypothetical protein [Synechococcus sp.]
MRRLEQVTALVVAAGLAIVSYWLFFSWAGGGGYSRQKQRSGLDQGHRPGLDAVVEPKQVITPPV